MATFTKPPFSLKVVWKNFQFKKNIVSEPGLRFSEIETVSESVGLPLKFVISRCEYVQFENVFCSFINLINLKYTNQWFERFVHYCTAIQRRLIREDSKD